ncbi:hypothetical protein EGW08_021017 [Elysia chlorotica]|uniref:N-acetyltransferase domain-containing protein n=1 Tax=Elysia chlorotica TaxID=188477 RepID=A0A433SPQ4_ELYCH|nr:hypothetical protein EGW08_021017 [Elysia chlorotica]
MSTRYLLRSLIKRQYGYTNIKQRAACFSSRVHYKNDAFVDNARKSILTSQVVIRKAALTDHSAVLDLIDENGAHDYIPALYPHLVSDKDNFTVVATLEGRVVGLTMASVLDGGLTVTCRSSRVHKDFRKLGIHTALFDYIQEYSSQLVPLHAYKALAITDRDYTTCAFYFKYGYRPTLWRQGLQMAYQIPNSQPTGIGEDNPTNPIKVKELTRFDLHRIFQAHGLCRQLYPQGRLFNNYVGYRLMEENIRHLVTPWGGAFASFQEPRSFPLASCEDFSDHANPTKNTIGTFTSSSISCHKNHSNCLDHDFPNNVAMVTFYNCYSTTYGAFYSLDAYAMPGLSRDHFQAHLRHNLKTLRRRFPGQRAALALTFDTTTSRECVISCLSEQGISELLPCQEKWQILCERTSRK